MSRQAHFSPELFRFLAELRNNNRREWFLANKERYERVVRDPALRFIEEFAPELRRISPRFVADPRPSGGSLFRIYRDTRFAKDKSPYKTHVGIHFPRRTEAKDVHAPGFYLHLEPGGCFGAAGMWRPDSLSLTRVRQAILRRPRTWQAVLRAGLAIEGESLQRPPAGYRADHPFIEDLKRKDFVTSVTFTEQQLCSPGFLRSYAAACRRMTPLVKFLTHALGLAW